jgi:Ni/Co efflux regulator RcnB
MKRMVLAALAAVLMFLPGLAAAQEQTFQQQAYQQRRQALMRELEAAQKQLAESRGNRVELSARIESVIAQLLEQRAQQLLMSDETTALQQIDSILTASQDNLLAQRDRFAAIGDAARRRSGAVLVVLLRADSSTTTQLLQTASLTVDNVPAESRTYSVAANNALQIGAVDQMYRADVLPTSHTVTLQVSVEGQTLTQTVNVAAAEQSVTYVQFAVRNGQLVPTTWTSRGTTPF